MTAFALGLLVCANVLASVTENELGQFHHFAWNAGNGAPHDVWSIAQGSDGFLWLGTGEGLYQFDGVTFRQQKLAGSAFATSNITALGAFSNGDLWEGFYLGGVALIRQGRAQTFGKEDGFPSGWVLAFAQTRDGAIWAAAKHGLARYENGRWHTIGLDWGLPPNGSGWVLTDKEGTLWVSGPSSLYFLVNGSHRFQDTGIPLGQGAVLALDGEGGLWVSDKVKGTRSLPGVTAKHPRLSVPEPAVAPGFIMSNRMLFDREGRMWGTDSQAGGIYVVLDPKAIEDGRSLHAGDLSLTYKRAGGLTSDLTDPVLGDVEGNVWVGTNFGLDSFRLSNVSSVSGLQVIPGVDFNAAVDSDGGVWIINGKTIYKADDGKLRAFYQANENIHDLACGDDGSLWFETEAAVFRLQNGVATNLGLPDNLTEAAISSFTADGHGGAWVGFANERLYHWTENHWVGNNTSSIRDTPTALARENGNLWIGYTKDRVEIRNPKEAHVFSAQDGLSIGAVSSLNVETPLKLVGGEQGLARYQNGRFLSLSSFGNERIAGVSGIAYKAGIFWLNTNKGVIRVSFDELEKAFDTEASVPTYKLFQYRDGLPGFALQSKPVATALVDKQGRIWLDTDLGIAWIDPSHVRTNESIPHVEVVDVESNGKHYQSDRYESRQGAAIKLPQRTTNLTIAYTATSLSVPEGTTFQYRLEGIDEGWQDVGTRREANYANLAPGVYKFEVSAKNEDGVWSAHPAALSFTIPPVFYQTSLFRIACATVAIGLAALFFVIRVNRVSENIRIRVHERYMERERIARELHDTLLQSVQGLTMIFESTVKQPRSSDAQPDDIDEVLSRADAVMIEVRDRVLDLRRSSAHSEDLSGEFLAVSNEYSKLWNPGRVMFRVLVNGVGRPLASMVREEVYCVGREAVINAYKHANADSIEVEIDYGGDRFCVRIRDDGYGIGEDLIRSGGKPGHWGMKGMKERAQRIGGSLLIRGEEGVGTEIELSIPARIAYVTRLASLRTSLLRLLVVRGKGGT